MSFNQLQTEISHWDLYRHFSAWSSVNGLPHIILTNSACLRLIWTSITFFAFFAGLYQTGSLINDYYSYPVNLKTNTSYDTLAFPSVSLCNANAWKLNQASGTPLRQLIAAYNFPAGPNAQFGLGWLQSEERALRARQWMWQMGEKLAQLAQNGNQIGYSFDEFIVSCTFNKQSCNRSHFIDFYDPYYGHCFTFNQQAQLNSSIAGPKNGLRVLLRLNSTEYLPWVEAQAAVISIDLANSTSYVDSYGYFARPGFATRIGVQFYNRQKLPAPFSNCTDLSQDVSNQKIYYGGDYEVDACTRSCIQDRIVFLCGCYSPLFNRPTNTTHPAALLSCLDAPNPTWALDCVNGILNYQKGSQWNPSEDCDCPFSCDQSYYRISMSQAKWPAKNYIPSICANSKELRRHWGGSQSTCNSWIGQNTALVEIFHQRLTTITVVESQAYQVIDFIADAGGALGLWLGMSAISALEVLILLVMAIAYCYARPARRAKIRPGYDYFAHFIQKPKNKSKFALATPPVRNMAVAAAAAIAANTNKLHKSMDIG